MTGPGHPRSLHCLALSARHSCPGAHQAHSLSFARLCSNVTYAVRPIFTASAKLAWLSPSAAPSSPWHQLRHFLKHHLTCLSSCRHRKAICLAATGTGVLSALHRVSRGPQYSLVSSTSFYHLQAVRTQQKEFLAHFRGQAAELVSRHVSS